MTKRHFQLFADELLFSANLEGVLIPQWVLDAVMRVFHQENPRFDRARFMLYVAERERKNRKAREKLMMEAPW